MRKLMTLFLVVGLLAMAAPAMAQTAPGANPGSLDPLSLITSGAVLPYVGGGANMSFLEAYAPNTSVVFHMFFFDPSCVRAGDSAQITLTENDVEFLRVDNLGNTPTSGLVTGGGVDSSGFFLRPDLSPVHLRVLWVNAAQDYIRVIDPIALSTLDNDSFGGVGTWNNLRTGAAFWLPLEGTATQSALYFICPNTNIIGTTVSATRAFATAAGFPPLFPVPQPGGQTTPLLLRVYNDEENFLRDVTVQCNCFTRFGALDLSNVYANAQLAPFGTFTEVSGGTLPGGTAAVCSTTETVTLTTVGQKNAGNACDFAPANPAQLLPTVPPTCPSCTSQFRQITPAVPAGGPFSFTGYRSVVAGTLDLWNRLHNSCFQAIGGETPFACDPQPPNFGR
jgi:hypothetical protein